MYIFELVFWLATLTAHNPTQSEMTSFSYCQTHSALTSSPRATHIPYGRNPPPMQESEQHTLDTLKVSYTVYCSAKCSRLPMTSSIRKNAESITSNIMIRVDFDNAIVMMGDKGKIVLFFSREWQIGGVSEQWDHSVDCSV